MPYAPPKVCCEVGCGAVTTTARCDKHTVLYKRAYEQTRKSSSERGYNARWQRVSKLFLKRGTNALCACGCNRPSTVVDHIQPHRGDAQLFWDEANWQGMAKACHDAKTAREDGRWAPHPHPDARG